MTKNLPRLVLSLSAVLLVACSGDSDVDFEADQMQAQEQAIAQGAATPEALFDVGAGLLPSPNNLAFAGTEDGTLNITIPEDATPADPRIALNTLDGFSTIEPISASFSAKVIPESVIPGETIRVFELGTDATTGAQTVAAELQPTEFTAVMATDTTLAILPLRPLKESTSYMFVVTNGVLGEGNIPSRPSSQFLLVSGESQLGGIEAGGINQLEPVREYIRPLVELAESQQILRGQIAVLWSMQTQSITSVLQTLSEQNNANNIALAPTGLTTAAVAAESPGIADIYAGTLEVPYYRAAATSPNDANAVSSFWLGAGGSFLTRLNPTPVATTTLQIPVLMTVPNAGSGQTMPASGWPITIFQHGIGGNRTFMFGLADRMALEGRALIAIDQPMHGLTDTTNPFYLAANERTFNIDLVNNDTQAPGPDGAIDASGTHYYSPALLLASRDNLRQAAADLMVLSESVGNIPAVEVDISNITFIGHSLGGTVGTTFLAFAKDELIRSATLGMPAAGLARMLLASPAYGPLLDGALTQAGIAPDTPERQSFLVSAQTVIDSGDAINYASAVAAKGTPIHMIEVVGNEEAGIPPDQTVPNNVPGAPLAGTDPLARLMGFDPAAPVSAETAGPGLVQFIDGGHCTLLTPQEFRNENDVVTCVGSLAAFQEMQNQTAVFASTGGTKIQIDDPSVIKGAN